jgi:hypothetical protein
VSNQEIKKNRQFTRFRLREREREGEKERDSESESERESIGEGEVRDRDRQGEVEIDRDKEKKDTSPSPLSTIPAIICPWHKYRISLEDGTAWYQQIMPPSLSNPSLSKSSLSMSTEWKSKGIRMRRHFLSIRNNDIYILINQKQIASPSTPPLSTPNSSSASLSTCSLSNDSPPSSPSPGSSLSTYLFPDEIDGDHYNEPNKYILIKNRIQNQRIERERQREREREAAYKKSLSLSYDEEDSSSSYPSLSSSLSTPSNDIPIHSSISHIQSQNKQLSNNSWNILANVGGYWKRK